MRTGHEPLVIFVVSFLLGATAPGATGEDSPQPGPDARVGRILDDWQRRSAARTSLDVRFTGKHCSPKWGDEPFTGRAVLQKSGPALVETVNLGPEGKSTQMVRFLWADDLLHHASSDTKQDFIYPIAAQDRGRLPAMLALPFFWNLNVKELESRYRVTLLKEDAETWLLRITPLQDEGLSSFSTAFLQLDQATYLPRFYRLVEPDGKSYSDYRVTETRCDQRVSEEDLRISEDDGWKVIRVDVSKPLAKLFLRPRKLDLLP